MKNKEKKLPLFEIPASNEKGWAGGAFCTVFVVSKDYGNYMCTGYRKEVKEFIQSRGKSIARFCLHSSGETRVLHECFDCNFIMHQYTGRYRPRNTKKNFTIVVNVDGSREIIHIKRFPSRFINFAEKLENFKKGSEIIFTVSKYPEQEPPLLIK